MSSDFTPDQKRYLEGFASGLTAARAARGQLPAGTAAQGEPTGPDAIHIKAQDRVLAAGGQLADQEKFKREQHPFDAYERLKQQARNNEPPKPADNFRWRFYGLFYVAPAQNVLHVPAAHPQRHPQALAARRACRSRRTLCRRLFARHHPRQSADARDRAEERGGDGRGDPGPRPRLARLGRRQYPQRHRHADRRHRSAGADRHAALCARMAFPHPQRTRALRPAAQVQRRLRRRRPHSRCWRTPTTSASRRSR